VWKSVTKKSEFVASTGLSGDSEEEQFYDILRSFGVQPFPIAMAGFIAGSMGFPLGSHQALGTHFV
jgi:hypothetical protein